MLYLDASAVVPLVVEEASSTAIARFTRARVAEFFLSNFASTEVVSALSRLRRKGDLDPLQVDLALDEFDQWRRSATTLVDVMTDDFTLADRYVRSFELKLRTPDAIHLAVAVRLGARLVTLDDRLAEAARSVGVAVERPA